jgi:hypothetical protein
MKTKILMAMLCSLILVSCTGKRGPMGPAGPGSRTVYTSTGVIPTDNLYTVEIPEITINDMPSVSTYIRLTGNSLWYELPCYFENSPDFGQACFYTEGHVSFVYCSDFYYKVVIVK